MTGRALALTGAWDRWGLWAGVGYAALQLLSSVLFVVWIVPALPPLDADPAAFAALYAAKAGETMLLLYLSALSLPLLLAFLAALAERLRTATGGLGLALTAAVAGLAMAAIPLAANVVEAAFGTSLARIGGDPAAVKAIDGLIPISNAVGALPRTLLLVVVAIGALSARMAPRWLGWAALVLAAVSVAGSLTVIAPAFFPILTIGVMLFALWVLALSIALLRSRISPRT